MMKLKTIANLFLLICCWQAVVFAQCENEPRLEKANVLAKENLKVPSSVEAAISINASVSGASWQKKGAEAAVLTVFVNGKYHQDVILYAGEEPFLGEKNARHDYDVFLGELSKGDNEIAITLNKDQTPASVKGVVVNSMTPSFSSLSDDKLPAHIPVGSKENSGFESLKADFIARQNAPFIYARPDTVGKFSDIPLITYYETFDEPQGTQRIRYTTIFTNEDGGTQSAALMARWGRMTDIEWVYEIVIKEGKIISEIYQGANHQVKTFGGKRAFGNHPLIFDATINNNFADTGCSALRLALSPIQANLTNSSRETVMDKNAWTYRIMAEEAMREGRVNGANLGANTIDDLRNYLFVETYSDSNKAKVSLELTDDKAGKSASDFGDERLRVDRSGYFRIAVGVPNYKSKPKTISLRCHDAPALSGGSCQNARVVKILRLDNNFIPREIAFETKPAASLKQSESIVYKIKN